jgi:predicted glycogen debranching enzyme
MFTDSHEWLEADGLGGFASGTATGIRTRRYHALLLTATRPPSGRMVLVNGFDAWVTTGAGRWAISSQRYAPDVIHPDGMSRIEHFEFEPWPRWVYRLEDGTRIEQVIVAVHGRSQTILTWRLLEGDRAARLDVRPFFSGRDYHSLHHENGVANLDAISGDDGSLTWEIYRGVPAVRCAITGDYHPDQTWYRNFLYTAERERGLDDVEDLASPGMFSFALGAGPAYWVVGTESVPSRQALAQDIGSLLDAERARRAAFGSSIARAADAFFVTRHDGSTVIAGYPWFTDWGRDTFIALPGLCLTSGRLTTARDILLEWANAVSEGMLPNRFPDAGELPEFNAVDASLWFIVAVGAFFDAAAAAESRFSVSEAHRHQLDDAVLQIVEGYSRGTRHRIHADADGLLAAGVPGLQLTWMDARVGDRVVTPRIGKPVEVQALWINALAIAGERDPKWLDMQQRAQASFTARFWNDARGCLYDVVDVDHVPGDVDDSLRPNQILAVGGLPRAIVPTDRARRLVDLVARELETPLGLRTLGRGEPGYIGTYGGGVVQRDGAYHQGTAWPWLLYAYGQARLRTGLSAEVHDIIAPLESHLTEAGLGHVSEVVSGDAPYTAGGCPFQAWSLAALLQLKALAANVIAG